MEENRCGKAQGIDPVKDAPVAPEDIAIVLDATVPLDRRHDKSAPESEQADHECEDTRLPPLKRGGPVHGRSKQRRTPNTT